jgi:hypothetical protein
MEASSFWKACGAEMTAALFLSMAAISLPLALRSGGEVEERKCFRALFDAQSKKRQLGKHRTSREEKSTISCFG